MAQYNREVKFSQAYNFDEDGNPRFPQEDFTDVKQRWHTLLQDPDTSPFITLSVFQENKPQFKTLEEEFMLYCDKYNKSYADKKEYNLRKKNFKKNMDSIKKLYDKNSPEYEDLGNLRLGFNEYSDLSEQEWK